MPRKAIESRYLTNSEAYELITKKLSPQADNIIVKRVVEHLASLDLCDPNVARKAREELLKIGFSEEAVVILINARPKEPAEARALLSPFEPRKTLEDFSKALEILSGCK